MTIAEELKNLATQAVNREILTENAKTQLPKWCDNGKTRIQRIEASFKLLQEKREIDAESKFKNTVKPKLKPDEPNAELIYQINILQYHALKIDIKHPDDARIILKCVDSLKNKVYARKSGWEQSCIVSLNRKSRIAVFSKHRGCAKTVRNIIFSLFVPFLVVSLIGAAYNKAKTGKFSVPWWQTSSRQMATHLKNDLEKAKTANVVPDSDGSSTASPAN